MFERELPYNEYQAAVNANSPSALNPFATIADLMSGSTTSLVIDVKINEVGGINKGQAVYVNGANGTNILVGKADYSTEATSSKTLGLLITSGANNDFRQVITQGSLKGTGGAPLDTSAAAAGDPVWLGDDGNLIFGTINKPYAPNHLVFIGIVVESSATVGEIFVKVQNGFELDEVHDIDLKTTPPSIGDTLVFNGSLWVPQAASGSGRFGIADTNGVYTYYTDLSSAMAAAVAGQTVEMFADYTELSTTVFLVDDVNINMNGHTYTFVNSTGIDAFVGNNVNCKITNGEIIFDAGASLLTANAMTLNASTVDATGLTVKVVSSGGLGTCLNVGAGTSVYNAQAFSLTSTAISIAAGAQAYSCVAQSIDGIGIQIGPTSGTSISTSYAYNCIVRSTNGIAIAVYRNGIAFECYAVSSNNYGMDVASGIAFGGLAQSGTSSAILVRNTGAVSGPDSRVRGVEIRAVGAAAAVLISTIAFAGVASVENCSISSGTGADAISVVSTTGTLKAYIFNCTIRVTSAANYCISGPAIVPCAYSSNIMIGATTPVNLAVITQNLANTMDNQGNILV